MISNKTTTTGMGAGFGGNGAGSKVLFKGVFFF